MAKAKFKNLKDRYRKERKKVKPTRSGGEGGCTGPDSSWQHFNSLGFLNDNEVDSKTVDNLAQTFDSDESENDMHNTLEEDEISNDSSSSTNNSDTIPPSSIVSAVYTAPVAPSSVTSTVITTPTTPSSVARTASSTPVPPTSTTPPPEGNKSSTANKHGFKKTLTSNERYKQRVLRVEEDKLNFIKSLKDQQNQKHEPDADEKFLLSLVPFMKQLSALQNLKLRNSMQEAVVQALIQKEMEDAGVTEVYNIAPYE